MIPNRFSSICDVFCWQAAETPFATAVTSDLETLTYGELEARSNRLARYLFEQGVRPGSNVAFCIPRSPDMIVTMLAILKTGSAYVPLAIDSPAVRNMFLLRDTGAAFVVTTGEYAGCAGELPVQEVLVDSESNLVNQQSPERLPSCCTAETLAYIMYTSGSTGAPKGVLVEHRSVLGLVTDANYANLDRTEIVLQLAPVSFDASTFEIWAPLLNGGSLVLFPDEIPSLDRIAEVIARQKITTLWLSAGLFHLMADYRAEAFRPLRQLLAGGDVLSVAHVRRVLASNPGMRVINGYGPTEATTFAACHVMWSADQVTDPVPLGRALPFAQLLLLDEALRPVPAGSEGELYIGGSGVARGYLNQPELTAERFIRHPSFERGQAPLYRTGDLCRFLPNGLLQFCGRMDRQVKISGFRIEPGEVESQLRAQDSVQDSSVIAVAGPAGEKKLVAFVILAPDSDQDSKKAAQQLRSALQQVLPSYMQPAAILPVREFPLTQNGKLDREALAQSLAPPEASQPAPALADQSLNTLAKIWQQVLGSSQPVSATANFFDLGGDSLQLIEVHSELHRIGITHVTIIDLFAHPNLQDLAKHLETAAQHLPQNQDNSSCQLIEQSAALRRATRERNQQRSNLERMNAN